MDDKEKDIVIWGMHSQDDNLFLNSKQPVIAIGWKEIGSLQNFNNNIEDYKTTYSNTYKNKSKSSIAGSVAQIYKFKEKMEIGDYVVFSSKSDRKINIGVIDSDYFYQEGERYPNRRKVKWLKHIPRTCFTQGALYEIGSFLSVFQIKNYSDEILNALDKNTSQKQVVVSEDDTIQATAETIMLSTQDYVLKKLSSCYKGYPLESVCESLLKAMGYFTKASKQGGDRGVDLIAYKDELPPRIIVQVKSYDSDVPERDVQSLKGALKQGDYGLFITLGNYSKNAQQYIEENPMIKAINGREFVDLILKFYDKMDDKFKSNMNLIQVYLPIAKQGEND